MMAGPGRRQSGAGGEKLLGSGYNLEVEPTGLTDGLNVGGRESEEGSRTLWDVFCLITLKGSPFSWKT